MDLIFGHDKINYAGGGDVFADFLECCFYGAHHSRSKPGEVNFYRPTDQSIYYQFSCTVQDLIDPGALPIDKKEKLHNM